jgi:hypothetical protein
LAQRLLAAQAALVMQGRHAVTGAQMLRPQDGVVSSYEVTFWAPESLAWLWTQSKEKLQVKIEQAVIAAADHSRAYLTQSGLAGAPAQGFGASTVLHVRTWTVDEETGVPGPLLHVHSYLAAVLDADGVLRVPRKRELFGSDGILSSEGASALRRLDARRMHSSACAERLMLSTGGAHGCWPRRHQPCAATSPHSRAARQSPGRQPREVTPQAGAPGCDPTGAERPCRAATR